ncbi:SRPBCC family protein [Nocardioides humi]|uniref:Polyketide cyclase / dehydrase and lipid transport n=1 Tax=Nocardioides humi TaxID=449461 RepID=A0ABN1ZXP3_9ACTN|nr:SRPBCC family protein [Nocardioides humi]
MERVIATTVPVPRPAAEVAGYVLDWGNDPRWRSRVTSLMCTPPGRAEVGQRQVERLTFWGMRFETHTEVVAADALHAGYVGGQPPVEVRGHRQVEPDGPDRCTLTVLTRLRLSGAIRLAAPLLVPAYRRGDRADLDRLVALLAGQAGD